MFEEPDGSKVFTINHQSFSNFTSKPSSTPPAPLYRSRSCLGSRLNNGFVPDDQIPVTMTTTIANNNNNNNGCLRDGFRLPSIINRGIFYSNDTNKNNNNNNNNNIKNSDNDNKAIGRSRSDNSIYEINQDILNWSKGENNHTSTEADKIVKNNNNGDGIICNGRVDLMKDTSETRSNGNTQPYLP